MDSELLARTARELEEARHFSEALIDTVRHGIVILDENLCIERANACFYKMFHVTPEETLGHALSDVGGGRWNFALANVRLEQALFQKQNLSDLRVADELTNMGPRVMMLNVRVFEGRAEAKQRVLLTIEDVTDAEAAAQTRQALERAESLRDAEAEVGRAKDHVLARMSHELRGPLAAIGTWVHVMSGEDVDRATLAAGLEAIRRSVESLVRVSGDLGDISRILSGELYLSQRLVDLLPIVETVVGRARRGAEPKALQFEVRKTTTSAHVFGDPDRLERVLWNVLSNAVKFTSEKGRIEICVRRAGESWEVVVADNGQGISPELLPNVFERRRPTSRGRGGNHGGLGFGLAVARQLVELHGGEIEATSLGKGEGSTFTIRLPVPALAAAPGETGVATPPVVTASLASELSLEGLHILLVEDDVDTREALVAALKGFGARMTTAGSVSEALDVLPQARPDLLVSDIGMPLQDGYDLIRQVRALSPEQGGLIPAAALTAYGAPRDRERILAAGFQIHIAKPAEPTELVVQLLGLAAGRKT
jgi:two-component system, chemotaxis family, CheB/CheR fusion protein